MKNLMSFVSYGGKDLKKKGISSLKKTMSSSKACKTTMLLNMSCTPRVTQLGTLME
ncbi:hypothetical protein DSO57_1009122 [Entomophthora muscae]|uniref:Uncharacterized protein n=1 Tax=Entomophthora muscae TaxID=34485 RepID=A0ACC2TTZ8_9FUNG|nr:hypothetical protein DSO57_1009122 [Entomophthora muscae]